MITTLIAFHFPDKHIQSMPEQTHLISNSWHMSRTQPLNVWLWCEMTTMIQNCMQLDTRTARPHYNTSGVTTHVYSLCQYNPSTGVHKHKRIHSGFRILSNSHVISSDECATRRIFSLSRVCTARTHVLRSMFE